MKSKNLIGLILAASVFAGGASYGMVSLASGMHNEDGSTPAVALSETPTPTATAEETTPTVEAVPTETTSVIKSPTVVPTPVASAEVTETPTSAVPFQATITVTPTPPNDIHGKASLTGIIGKIFEAGGLQIKITDAYRAEYIAFHDRGLFYQYGEIFIVARGTFTNTGATAIEVNLNDDMMMEFGGPYKAHRENDICKSLQMFYYEETYTESATLQPGQSVGFTSVYSLDKNYYGNNCKLIFREGFPLCGQEIPFGYTY